nr:unnamed protein product [Spirometra erinaceieuropaei]
MKRNHSGYHRSTIYRRIKRQMKAYYEATEEPEPAQAESAAITMSERPHREGKPNKKYFGHEYLGDVSLPSTPSSSDSTSDTSSTIPKGQSPIPSNGHPLSSTPKRKRRRRDYSRSERKHRKQKQRSVWTIRGIKKLFQEMRELRGEMAALREEVRCQKASNFMPSAVETPIVQRVSTLGGYDDLTTGVSDATYRRNLVAYLAAMGGDTVTAFAERLFFTLFSEDVAQFLTFYGRKPGTRAFFDSPVYSVILEVFNGWNKDHRSDRQQLEHALKNAFKKGHDRYQRKCQRASASRQSQEPSTIIEDPANCNGEGQA